MPPKNKPSIPEGLLSGLSRQSLATGPAADLTREYLETGVELIADNLRAPAEGVSPFLAWLSQRELVSAVTARGSLAGAVGTLRDRWPSHASYIADLLTWIMHERSRREPPRLVTPVSTDPPRPSAVVRHISRQVQQSVFRNPLFRLQLVALAVTAARRGGSPTGGDADMYEEIDARWRPLITAFLTERGVSLRRGITEREIVEILTAVGEGLALRELERETTGASHERRLALQGITALALLAACVDIGDGLTLDEAVDRIAERD